MAIPRQRIRLPRRCWRSALSSAISGSLWEGRDIERFEQGFAAATDAGHAIAVSSGRAALNAILDSLDLDPDAEIICSAFGYPVVPHLARSKGYTLKFVDCELQTLGMDPDLLEQAISSRTGAVIVTHLYGVPCRIRQIVDIAAKHDVPVIEDCAHCLGARVGGRHVGSFGRASYFSFETSKMINTLGGGMVTTSTPDLAERIERSQDDQPRKTSKWLLERLARTSFEAAATTPLLFSLGPYPILRFASRGGSDDAFATGYQADHFTMKGRTGRFTNYQALLGIDQLADAETRLRRRVGNAKRLIDALRGVVPLQEPAEPDAVANYLLVTALIERRADVGRALLRRGVDTKHHYMRDCSRALETGETFDHASRAEAEVLHLPAFPELSEAGIDRIAAAVREVVGEAAGESPPRRAASNCEASP